MNEVCYCFNSFLRFYFSFLEPQGLQDPCARQPCLNGGRCVSTDVVPYKCECVPGFDGENCELDARICQTQKPCGQSQDIRCQSFRLGAALQYMCILPNGNGYALNLQQGSYLFIHRYKGSNVL